MCTLQVDRDRGTDRFHLYVKTGGIFVGYHAESHVSLKSHQH